MQKYLAALVIMLLSTLSLADLAPADTSSHVYTYNLTQSKPSSIPKRTLDFPTQLVNMEVDLSDFNMSCDAVFQHFRHIFLSKLNNNLFMVRGDFICTATYEKAKSVHIAINFDPQHDEAVQYLQQFLVEYEGMDFYGVPFNVQSAKGVIILLNIEAGTLKNNAFSVMYSVNNALYFSNLYEFNETFIADMNEKMRTANPQMIADFMHQWAALEDTHDYLQTLTASNYVQISPRIVFLLNTAEKIYKPKIYDSYQHNCSKYSHKTCLN